MAESTLTANGRTTVPAEIRLAIGAVSGTRLVWRYVTEGRLSVRVKNKTAAEVKGLVKMPKGVSLKVDECASDVGQIADGDSLQMPARALYIVFS